MKKLLLVCLLALFALPVRAESQIAPLETVAQEAILIDVQTGTVLFEKNADQRMPTSSMIKILTTYLVFDAIQSGKIHLDDELTVSEHAWRQEGSRTFLNLGQKVRVEDLLRGVIIQSGNDAAVVLAEALGGSEGNFAGMMNTKAQELGMDNSHFMNATGLPDPNHYSTARDLAKLALAVMRDHGDYYHYYKEIDFTYNNIKQGNRNPLLYRGIGVDGLKTGHTEAAGYGLIASSLREGRRMLLVVNGLHSMQERADEPTKILDWGYREYGMYELVKKDQKMADAKVWLGTAPSVSLVAAKDLAVTLPRAMRPNLKVDLAFEQPVKAPLVRGQEVGKIIASAPGMASIEVPLVAGENVGALGFFGRMWAKLQMLMGHKE